MKRIICGIYIITNKLNNKKYIGKSVNIYSRWKKHRGDLKKGTHRNPHLQYSWNKYGKENFKFDILEECDEEVLAKREIYWMNHYNTLDDKFGYNIIEETEDGGRILSRKSIMKKYTDENGNCSLVLDEDVIKIKQLYLDGKNTNEIVKLLNKKNVNRNKISSIINLTSYVHIGKEYNDLIILKKQNDEIKYKEKVAYIKSILAKENLTIVEIAKLVDEDRKFITDISRLKIHSEIVSEYNDILKEKYFNNRVQKLTNEEVAEIKRIISQNNKITNKQLGKRYNIDKSVISNIRTLKVYNDVVSQYNDIIYERYIKNEMGLSDLEITEIKRLVVCNLINYKDILKMFDIGDRIFKQIINVTKYKDIGKQYNKKLLEIKNNPSLKHKKSSINSKLTEEQVIYIKQELINGKNNKELALKFNIDQSGISNIKMLKSHYEIGQEYNDKLKELFVDDLKPRQVLTNSQIKEIKYRLCTENKTNKEWGIIFSIDGSTISRMKNNKKYIDIAEEYNPVIQAKYIDKNEELANELLSQLLINKAS